MAKKSDIDSIIWKWALDNARRFDGKANPGAVIGKLLKEMPEIKKKLKDISPKVQAIVAEVNGMSIKQQLERLKDLAPELLEHKKIVEKKELKELKNAKKGKVVLRMAPSPSGPLHIGHAFVLSINSEYARKYDGKLILRIDDTNPENIYPQSYKMIEEDANWLTEKNMAQVVCQSDRLKDYYDYGEKLFAKGKAYVCTCNPDKFRELILKKQECPCRKLSIKEQHLRWDKMFLDYKPGDAVVRIKTDIKHRNPALRDWSAFRVNLEKHPKQGTKNRVWPLMNFAVACDDHDLKVTHAIRGKDHMDNARKQAQLCEFFKWKPPVDLYFGRINFKGAKLSTTETRKRIEYGEFTGWDDVRLQTIRALKKRGYQPKAFVKFAIDMGLTLTDKTVTIEEFFKMLNSHNRDIIDKKANRYFFVWNPVKLTIDKSPKKTVEINLHPDFPRRGKRKFKFDGIIWITKDDLKDIQTNNLCRLMDCINFKKKGKKYIFDSEEYGKYKQEGSRILHWLPSTEKAVKVQVLMPDGKIKKGIAESDVGKLKIGDIVQFERFGFCKLNRIENKLYEFCYAHR